MSWELPVRMGNELLGRGEYTLQGPRVWVGCVLPMMQGICKLHLRRGEHRLLVGTPAPRGTGLVLERTFSRSELERWQVWPPEALELERAEDTRVSLPKDWQWTAKRGGWEGRRRWNEHAPIPEVQNVCHYRLDRGWITAWRDEKGNLCSPL